MTAIEKAASIQLKFAPGEAGTLTGYASVFGPPADRHGDIIAPGAFAAFLKSGNVPLMLWAHDQSEPIGVWTDLREDATGLAVKGRLVLETRRGAEAYALLKAGALNGLSIGYRVIASEDLPAGGRLLATLDVAEISLVAMPSATRARVTSIKSGEEITPRILETILRDAGVPKAMAVGVIAKGFRGAMDDRRDADAVAIKSITETLAAATARLASKKGN